MTPDTANLDTSSGGLVVYDTLPPRYWGWENALESDPAAQPKLRELVAFPDAPATVVPYRSNRVVIMSSAYAHEQDEFRFKERYVGV